MKPVLDALRRECGDHLRVQQVDVALDDQAKTIFRVRSLPVLVFYDASGREVLRHEGAMSREDIVKAWEGMGIMLQGRDSSPEGSVLPGPPR
jgi:thioredoxin 1